MPFPHVPRVQTPDFSLDAGRPATTAQARRVSTSTSKNASATASGIDALRGSARQWTLLALHWRRQSRPEVALRYLNMATSEAKQFFDRNYPGYNNVSDDVVSPDAFETTTIGTAAGEEGGVDEEGGAVLSPAAVGAGGGAAKVEDEKDALDSLVGGGVGAVAENVHDDPINPDHLNNTTEEEETTAQILSIHKEVAGVAGAGGATSNSKIIGQEQVIGEGGIHSSARGDRIRDHGPTPSSSSTATAPYRSSTVMSPTMSRHPAATGASIAATTSPAPGPGGGNANFSRRHSSSPPQYTNPEPFRVSRFPPHNLDIYYENQATPDGLGSRGRSRDRRRPSGGFYSDEADRREYGGAEQAEQEAPSISRNNSVDHFWNPHQSRSVSLGEPSTIAPSSVEFPPPPPGGEYPMIATPAEETTTAYKNPAQVTDQFGFPPPHSAPAGHNQQFGRSRSLTTLMSGNQTTRVSSSSAANPERVFVAAKHIEATLRMNTAAILNDLQAHEESKEELMRALACADRILSYCMTQVPDDRLDALYNSGVSLKVLLLEALSETIPLCVGLKQRVDLAQLYREQAYSVAQALLPSDHPLVAYTLQLFSSHAKKGRSRQSHGSASTSASHLSPQASKNTSSGEGSQNKPDAPKKVKREELECSTMTDPIFDDLRSQDTGECPAVTFGYDLVEMETGFQKPTQAAFPWADIAEADAGEDDDEEEGYQSTIATTRLSSELENERMRKTKAMRMAEKGPFYSENPFKDFDDYNLFKKPRYESPNYVKEESKKLDYMGRMHRERVNHYDGDDLFIHRMQCTPWGHKVRRKRLVELQRLRITSRGRERVAREMDPREGIRPKQIEQDVRVTTTEIRNSLRSMAQAFPAVKKHIQRGDRIKEDDKARLISLMMSTRIKKNATDADYILRMKHMKEPLKSIWRDFIEMRKRETGVHIKFHRVQEKIKPSASVRRSKSAAPGTTATDKAGVAAAAGLGGGTEDGAGTGSGDARLEQPEPRSFLDNRFRDYRPKAKWAKEFQVQAYNEEEKRRRSLGLPPLEKGAVLPRQRNPSK